MKPYPDDRMDKVFVAGASFMFASLAMVTIVIGVLVEGMPEPTITSRLSLAAIVILWVGFGILYYAFSRWPLERIMLNRPDGSLRGAVIYGASRIPVGHAVKRRVSFDSASPSGWEMLVIERKQYGFYVREK